jgi:hypothetical protein
MWVLNDRISSGFKQKIRASADADTLRYKTKARNYKADIKVLQLKLANKRAKIERLKAQGGPQTRPEAKGGQPEGKVRRKSPVEANTEAETQGIMVLQRENRLQADKLRLVEHDLRSKTLELDSRVLLVTEKEGQIGQLREEIKRLRGTLETERLNSLGNQDKAKLIGELRDRNAELEVS